MQLFLASHVAAPLQAWHMYCSVPCRLPVSPPDVLAELDALGSRHLSAALSSSVFHSPLHPRAGSFALSASRRSRGSSGKASPPHLVPCALRLSASPWTVMPVVCRQRRPPVRPSGQQSAVTPVPKPRAFRGRVGEAAHGRPLKFKSRRRKKRKRKQTEDGGNTLHCANTFLKAARLWNGPGTTLAL